MCHSEWLNEEKVVSASDKRLAMIKRTIKVWDAMKDETIHKSFENTLGLYEI